LGLAAFTVTGIYITTFFYAIQLYGFGRVVYAIRGSAYLLDESWAEKLLKSIDSSHVEFFDIAFFPGQPVIQPRVPFWPVVLLIDAIWVYLQYRRWKSRQRFPVGCCVKCGYDLRASSGSCPECGVSIAG